MYLTVGDEKICASLRAAPGARPRFAISLERDKALLSLSTAASESTFGPRGIPISTPASHIGAPSSDVPAMASFTSAAAVSKGFALIGGEDSLARVDLEA